MRALRYLSVFSKRINSLINTANFSNALKKPISMERQSLNCQSPDVIASGSCEKKVDSQADQKERSGKVIDPDLIEKVLIEADIAHKTFSVYG